MSPIIQFIFIVCLCTSMGWRTDRRPKIMGDQIPLKSIIPNRKSIQKKIVQYHNYFRRSVVPKAGNMLQMKWFRKASQAAQKWAKNCFVLIHDSIAGRYVDNYGACGQNIFISTEKVPWLFAIKTWYLEKNNFTFGSRKNDLKVVGHYTQMVWAATHQVGCGLSKCTLNSTKSFYNYICNYCPIGNRPGQLGRPYRRGTPCAMCKNSCFAKNLCTNACHVADLWANCKQLYKMWPNWLCRTNSHKGRQRQQHCRATCTCRNKLHD